MDNVDFVVSPGSLRKGASHRVKNFFVKPREAYWPLAMFRKCKCLHGQFNNDLWIGQILPGVKRKRTLLLNGKMYCTILNFDQFSRGWNRSDSNRSDPIRL